MKSVVKRYEVTPEWVVIPYFKPQGVKRIPLSIWGRFLNVFYNFNKSCYGGLIENTNN